MPPKARRRGSNAARRRGRCDRGCDQIEGLAQLRNPLDADAPLIASWSTSAVEARRWVSFAEHPFPAGAVAAWWQDRDVSPWVLVDDHGTPAAYGELWDDADEDEVEIARVIVDPARRGEGVGRELIEQLLARAATLGRADCFLRVAPDNERAIALYRSTGFVDVDPADAEAWNQAQPVQYLWLRHPPAESAQSQRAGRV